MAETINVPVGLDGKEISLIKRADSELIDPGEGKTPEQLYEELIARVRRYHPSADISIIEKAYEVAKQAHGDQVRKSGEPYIIHPLCVAIILADLELDKETIAAGLLHDVIEDTAMSPEDMKAIFGEEVQAGPSGLFGRQGGGPG